MIKVVNRRNAFLLEKDPYRAFQFSTFTVANLKVVLGADRAARATTSATPHKGYD